MISGESKRSDTFKLESNLNNLRRERLTNIYTQINVLSVWEKTVKNYLLITHSWLIIFWKKMRFQVVEGKFCRLENAPEARKERSCWTRVTLFASLDFNNFLIKVRSSCQGKKISHTVFLRKLMSLPLMPRMQILSTTYFNTRDNTACWLVKNYVTRVDKNDIVTGRIAFSSICYCSVYH